MGEFDRWTWGPQVDLQPGETVVGCGHTAKQPLVRTRPHGRNGWRWWELNPPVEIASPSGAPGNLYSRWVVSCKACRQEAKNDIRKIKIREHWRMPESSEDHASIIRLLGQNGQAINEYLQGLSDHELIALRIEQKQLFGGKPALIRKRRGRREPN